MERGPLFGLSRGATFLCGVRPAVFFPQSRIRILFDFFSSFRLSGMSDVTHTQVPAFDGHAGSSANLDEKVISRKKISTMAPEERAAHLLLHLSDAAREVCVTAGKDVVGNLDGAEHIWQILTERFAPDAIDSILHAMAKFMHFKRTGQDMGTYLIEFDMLRRKAEARMIMGGGFPDEFASVLCMQNAALAKNENVGFGQSGRYPGFPECRSSNAPFIWPPRLCVATG